MAIADYTELVAEVSERTQMPNLAERADQYIGLAESFLNKTLRVSDMLVNVEIGTDENGEATLPSNALYVDHVYSGSRLLPLRLLSEMRPDCPIYGYALRGQSLVSSENESALSVTYYAEIPPLSAASPTNWLIFKAPEIYIHAVSVQAFVAARDVEQAAIERSFLETLIDDLQRQDSVARFAGRRLVIPGVARGRTIYY